MWTILCTYAKKFRDKKISKNSCLMKILTLAINEAKINSVFPWFIYKTFFQGLIKETLCTLFLLNSVSGSYSMLHFFFDAPKFANLIQLRHQNKSFSNIELNGHFCCSHNFSFDLNWTSFFRDNYLLLSNNFYFSFFMILKLENFNSCLFIQIFNDNNGYLRNTQDFIMKTSF